MPELVKVLNIDDLDRIVEGVEYRMNVHDEDLKPALAVILLNYGNRFVHVRCIKGEWEGRKMDIPRRNNAEDIPLCPNGHPLLEMAEYPKLALIVEEL